MKALIFHQITRDRIVNYEDVKEEKFLFIISQIHSFCKSISESSQVENINRRWLLTFDDGFYSDFEIVLPILKKFKIQGLFFITPSNIGKSNYMGWQEVIELSNEGMEIGSHSLTHKDMLGLNNQDILKEFSKSKKMIEDSIGKTINSFSFPYGRFSKNLVDKAFKLGYKRCFTSFPGEFNLDDKLLPRIPINSSMSKNELLKILNNEKFYLFKSILKYKMLDLAKKTLGIKSYWFIRKIINDKQINLL